MRRFETGSFFADEALHLFLETHCSCRDVLANDVGRIRVEERRNGVAAIGKDECFGGEGSAKTYLNKDFSYRSNNVDLLVILVGYFEEFHMFIGCPASSPCARQVGNNRSILELNDAGVEKYIHLGNSTSARATSIST